MLRPVRGAMLLCLRKDLEKQAESEKRRRQLISRAIPKREPALVKVESWTDDRFLDELRRRGEGSPPRGKLNPGIALDRSQPSPNA